MHAIFLFTILWNFHSIWFGGHEQNKDFLQRMWCQEAFRPSANESLSFNNANKRTTDPDPS